MKKLCSQKEISTPKTEVGKNYINNQVFILSEQLFPNRRPLSYTNLTKNMKTCLGENSTKIQHQNIKQLTTTTVTEVSPWNDQ